MQPTTKQEAQRMIEDAEQHARLCAKAARKAARFPDMQAEKQRAADTARANANRLRALLPTLPE